MVNQIKIMACRHVHSMVQSVSRCSGSESSSSPILDDNLNSPSGSTKVYVSSRLTSQSDKCSESSKHDIDSRHSSRSVNSSSANSQACDIHFGELDQQGNSKCSQSKKNNSEDSENRHFLNDYLWQKLESLIDQMISEEDGIPVRNVKSLMSTIPSTFTGSDIVHWLMEHTGASDVTEAVHLASRIASMGYIFCIDDHVLTVKNDGHTYYRFQTPFLYPSRCMEADTVDYAVYLCKRTMQNKQRLELAGFEAERLASLQNIYCHKWEFIYIQAEAEAKVDKKRDKLERLVLESQERAYWDLHRPPPGCINTTDIDMRKLCRAKRPKKTQSRPVNFPIPSGAGGSLLFSVLDGLSSKDKVAKLHSCFRTRIKSSKAAESLQNFTDQYSEFDLLLSTSNSIGFSGPNAVGSNQTNTIVSTSQLTSANMNLATTTTTTTTTIVATTSASSSNPISNNTNNITNSGTIYSDKLTQQNRSISATGFNGAVSLSSNINTRTGSGSGNGTSNIAAGQTSTAHGSLGHLIGSTTSSNTAYDPLQEPASALNPWISDNADYWTTDLRPKYLPVRRIKRWSFSIHELLRDPVGLEEFQRWLEKEFSAENLRFWQACQELKGTPLREVRQCVMNIYHQYLAPNAVEPLNVDSRIADAVRRYLEDESITTPNRYCFEEAEEHIFQLMKSDSYCRFLRSDVYRELFRGGKKKSKKQRSAVSTSPGLATSLGGPIICGTGGGGGLITQTVNFTGIE